MSLWAVRCRVLHSHLIMPPKSFVLRILQEIVEVWASLDISSGLVCSGSVTFVSHWPRICYGRGGHSWSLPLASGPFLEIQEHCWPEGESSRNINKKPQVTSCCCRHLSARFPGNATGECLSCSHRLVNCPLPECGSSQCGCLRPASLKVATTLA